MCQSVSRMAIPSVVFLSIVFAAGLLVAQRAEQGPKPVARADRAMVSSSHPEVTRAILEVLQSGGNAVDALSVPPPALFSAFEPKYLPQRGR